jgi:periplasmic protein TonB
VIDHKLPICAAGAILLHFAIAKGLDQLPHYKIAQPPQKVAIQVLEPPPPPPPEEPKPEEPKPEEPKEVPHEAPRPHPVHAISVASVAKDAPPTDKPVVTTDTTEDAVYGYSMESTSAQGTGPALPIGNTQKPSAPTGTDKAVKPVAAPIQAFEATKMPMPQGRCFGKYTEEAKAAGVEGTVVLDIIVGEDGHVRDIQVSQGLPSGLTQAAITALKQCTFTPGEKDGKPVPVKIRGFKIQFVLSEAQ